MASKTQAPMRTMALNMIDNEEKRSIRFTAWDLKV
jgi:hypothetical protein